MSPFTPTIRKNFPAHRGISSRSRAGMKRKKPTKSSTSFAHPEIQQIEQLLQFMTEHNLEEFEYSRGDLHIRLRKTSAGGVVAVPPKIYTWSSLPSLGRFMSRPAPGRRLL